MTLLSGESPGEVGAEAVVLSCEGDEAHVRSLPAHVRVFTVEYFLLVLLKQHRDWDASAYARNI